jgi:short-subunit dehydrogenase
VSYIPKRIVVIGASSSIAEYCLRLWAREKPDEIILVGRRKETLKPIAADLAVRSNATISCHELDFLDPAQIKEVVDSLNQSGPIDLVLIAHGVLSEQALCQADLQLCYHSLNVNGVSPVLFAEAFASAMEKRNHGHIVVIGSVAGDRGRKSNYVYGASKGLVERYVEGMQHRFSKTNVCISIVKPGPTDTPMTAHLKTKGVSLAPVEQVAQRIVNGVKTGRAVIYAPAKWQLIMIIIRCLPRMIFHKLDI